MWKCGFRKRGVIIIIIINNNNNHDRGFLSALEVFLNGMRYINPRFTYLLTYLHDNVYVAVVVAQSHTTRVHPVHIMNMERRQAAADPQTRPNDPGCESAHRLP